MPFADRQRVDLTNVSVQRTRFCESAGTVSGINSFTGFYIWAHSGVVGNSAPTISWTVTLESGTATKGVDFSDFSGLSAGQTSLTTTTNGNGSTRVLGFDIIQDTEFEGEETFIVHIRGTGIGVTIDERVTLTIVDDDAEPPVADIGGGMHAVARAVALVDNQPRLIPMLRSPEAGVSEFSLRASAGGVDAAVGFQAETVWGATSLSRTSDGFGDHEHLLATLGAHFRMSERLLLGGMLQFDRSESEPDGAGKSGEFTGKGWMFGPYFAFRDGSNPLYFEGRLLYGRSSNDVEEYVPAQGDDTARSASLDSERWLIQGRVEGTHHLGKGMTLIPLADFSHARDEMEAFRDSRGIEGGTRTVAVTKLQLGAEFEIPVETAKGELKLRPGLRLVVSDASNVGVVGNATVETGESAEYRSRIDFGIDYRLEEDLVLGFESFYSSGRDREEFESYGAGLNLQFEF